jgi:acylphosphatase
MSVIRLTISGHVQGVCYRAATWEKAHALGITGWVKNCPDGSVEIHAEGAEEKLNELEKWCWDGPPASEVESVRREAVSLEGCESFDIRHEHMR